MSVWIKNLKMLLENREVVILYGNVRDKYIHPQKSIVYENLTELLMDIQGELPSPFSGHLFFDLVKKEWEMGL